jgi:hypothetical protein
MTIQRALAQRVSETADTNDTPVDASLFGNLCSFFLDVTAQSGTTPTLDVDIEVKDPISGKWFVVASFTQVGAATPQERILADIREAEVRAAWVITGAAATYSFTVSMSGKQKAI